jgi:hypothetical protein
VVIRDDEIGVRFDRQTSHTAAVWFRQHELTETEVGQTPPGLPQRTANTERVSEEPGRA